MAKDRPAFKITTSDPGSELAGETAAAMAAASILFKTANPSKYFVRKGCLSI
jgi:endoglucanase